MPNVLIGGLPATIKDKRQGRPTLTRGLATIGALFRSSCFVPSNPTRSWAGLSAGTHPNSSPILTDPGCSSSGVSSPPSSSVEVKYFRAHASGRSKGRSSTGAKTTELWALVWTERAIDNPQLSPATRRNDLLTTVIAIREV